MISYLVEGLLNNSTSLLIEGFSNDILDIKLFVYLNRFNINTVSAINIVSLIYKTKLINLNVSNKYSKLVLTNKNKIVEYKINNYSYLNKINVK